MIPVAVSVVAPDLRPLGVGPVAPARRVASPQAQRRPAGASGVAQTRAASSPRPAFRRLAVLGPCWWEWARP